jgi:DNA-binding SARP family transcriptional activator
MIPWDGGNVSMAVDALLCPAARPTLRLLGGWQLCLGEAVVPVTTRERRVMSLLALRGERSRVSLARTLWPDSEEFRAYGNLRAAVWRIQHLQRGLLEEGQGALRLAPHVRVDVHQLHAIAHQLTADNRPTAGADAPQVLDADQLLPILSPDELLPTWDDDWVAEERALLHQLRLRALENLTTHLLDCANVDGALQAAMRAVTIDPLRESANRALILVHLADGNNAEAVRVYRSFQQRLSDELGVCVSRQIVGLIQAIHPSPQAGPPSTSAGAGERPGRRADFDRTGSEGPNALRVHR